MQSTGRSQRQAAGWVSALFVVGLLAAVAGCGGSTTDSAAKVDQDKDPRTGYPKSALRRIGRQVDAFCGDCHKLPRAEDFPFEAWPDEVQQGFDLYFASKRRDLMVPRYEDVLAYFQSEAPDEIELPPSAPSDVDFGGLSFTRVTADGGQASPAVAHLKWIPDAEAGPRLMICDMRSGMVAAAELRSDGIAVEPIAELSNPAHLEPSDLDGDGRQDFVVSDLGSFFPSDHDDGRVVWLRPDEGGYDPVVLAQSIGRVTDVQPFDVDNDQDQDLIVAEFGWRQTGGVRLLINNGLEDNTPNYESRLLDSRHGVIHVPVHDFNDDGQLDVVTLVSQEYERVELWLNDGSGGFDTQKIFAASMPSFGSTGLKLTDLDGDGDMDVLYTNGDILDKPFVRKEHGVHWLENLDGTEWKHHRLMQMPGVNRAVDVDLDGDGDLDVVACAFAPKEVVKNVPDSHHLASVVWLEQTDDGVFLEHVLELDQCNHAVLEVGDFDNDGDADIAVGNFMSQGDATQQPLLTVWYNDGPAE